MSKWIKCSERLPEIGVPVLTFDAEHGNWCQPLMRSLNDEGWHWEAMEWGSSNMLDADNYVLDDDYTCTHWSLPKPPEGGNDD